MVNLVEYQPDKVISLTKTKGPQYDMFAFAEVEVFSAHLASEDALVYILDGRKLLLSVKKKFQPQPA